jgi:cytochrome P450
MPNWLGNYYAEKWYPNPDDFRPERWLDGLAKTLEQEYIFTPFSMGKRSCIGKKLATIETKLLFAKVLSKFKLRLKEGYVHKLVQRSLYEPENTIELYFEPV